MVGDTMKTYLFADIPVTLETPFKRYLSKLEAYETDQASRYTLKVTDIKLTLPDEPSWIHQGRHRYRLEQDRITQWYLSDTDEILYCLEDDLNNNTAHLWIHASCDEDTKEEMAYVVSGLWFMDVAVREGLLPLHAGAIQIGKQNIAFMAPSKTGKSTLIKRLLVQDPQALRLNDDKIFLTLKEGCVWLYSTPFSGQQSLHTRFDGQLDVLIVLSQGDDNQLTLFPQDHVLHALLKNTHRPLHPPSYQRLLNTLDEIIPPLTLWQYHATNDDRAAEHLILTLKEINDAKNRR